MLALMKTSRSRGAQLADVPVVRPGKGETLIKVHRASICGSDLPIFNWTSWAPHRIHPPMIFGHEICGEIAECGPDVKNIRPGDRVAVESHIFCEACASCLAGDRHLCRKMSLIGVDANGGFAEYITVPERVLWKLGSHIPYDYASLMEPMGNALYATCVEPVTGKTVLVMGCGPQGLYAVQIAKAMGASLVVAVEKSPFRAKLAKTLGADHVFGHEGDGDLKEKLLGLKKTKEGFDVCLEMSGADQLVALAFQVLRNGGRLSLFGITAGKMGIDLGEDELDRLISERKVNLESVVSHSFPLKEAQQAFELFSGPQRDCGKIIFALN
ncbi:MAG: alcohol dehydrogenase catalytic domain-containing protein [Elusimicrobia bacterium]|nr:alcohol dehydrogenase catalytic domain-containing protein [Elusimicrobiota bacterium]